MFVLCLTRPRYQVSVYRTIGPLVYLTAEDLLNHFKTVFGGDTNIPADPEHAHAPPPPEPHMHPELDAEFTEAELKTTTNQ